MTFFSFALAEAGSLGSGVVGVVRFRTMLVSAERGKYICLSLCADTKGLERLVVVVVAG